MNQPSDQERTDIEPKDSVADEEPLIRLLWAQHDICDGKIMPEAISTSDLKGSDRGYSVNRERIARKEIIEALINYQRPRARSPQDRETAYLSRISSAKMIRDLKDIEGNKPFDIKASPTKATPELPENPAHADIVSIQKCTNKRPTWCRRNKCWN